MTIIAYSKGQLAGDRMGIVGYGRSATIQDTVKVFKSKCGRFAYGIAGDAFIESEREGLMELVFRQLLVHNASDGEIELKLSGADATNVMGIMDRNIIFMTADRAWRIQSSKYLEITHLDGYCSGNGSMMADVCLKFGLSAADTVKEVMLLQADCGGSGMDVVNASDLIPLFDPEAEPNE